MKWKKVVERAVGECPFIESRYQRQWPIVVYLKLYLSSKAQKCRLETQLLNSAGIASHNTYNGEPHKNTQTLGKTSRIMITSIPQCLSRPAVDGNWNTRSDVERDVNDSFAAALRGLSADLETFAPAFSQVGLTSVDHFKMMMKWPEAERNAFLKTDMKLNPFEFHNVRAALAKFMDEQWGTMQESY
ncbi:uncharacterized protein FIBRA_05710 [Fibroporia radiculosa]|uniref:Uncharacterized protein n=1 Tax=Fibroporia radiculosa TaxID=599839 RepID=J4H3N9_9APHY|nr:uncharacterized protein FIBRA_05710 [Fibroporia radiculosa]CCM03574.1 predicted protein [Fibroporia radiculosa]